MMLWKAAQLANADWGCCRADGCSVDWRFCSIMKSACKWNGDGCGGRRTPVNGTVRGSGSGFSKGNSLVVGLVGWERLSPGLFALCWGQLAVVWAEAPRDVLQQQHGLWFLPGTRTRRVFGVRPALQGLSCGVSTMMLSKMMLWDLMVPFLLSVWGSTCSYASWSCKWTLVEMPWGAGCGTGLVQLSPSSSLILPPP